jgi:UDP-2,3-diacylglucosamine pyrophosphatase LpxH
MKANVERISFLEAKMEDINRRLQSMDASIKLLHGKFDIITTSYVAKDTFNEYKKNRWLERMLIVLVTAIISGLIAFTFRELGV